MKDWIKKPLTFWRGLEEHNGMIAILLILIALLFAWLAWPVITGPK